ncbi:alpha/beta hydrolase [Protaetiibacter larvae]|uniref:Alpha/beta hydrolase n=1 Tax=Protaetiibacter larvae TaxID=2592654 RepID=A0A5C1Y7M7_9MICO|nr:alpha/beta hydrolase [Protaetiibacter larvae]QEO08922.1 alpha/beta hydrolase [Protaetiibacter larvae]
MDLALVDVDLRSTTAKLPVPDVSRAAVRRLARAATAVMPVTRAAGVRVETLRSRTARVRIYRPVRQRTDAVLLWVHGGGFVIGSPRQDERHCSETAAELGMVVVSAHYRLAPEHPFPAGLDDVTAAWQWLQAEAATLGVDPARVIVGGESAGGGLAACAVQRLRDQSPVQPIGQWLFCPMLDDRTAADRALDAVEHPVWNNTSNRVGWTAYLGQAPGAAALPSYAVAARRDDLTGLPPSWLSVGDIELFSAEVRDYARRLEASGVPVVLDLVAGGPHGFENWAADTAPARMLLARARGWLAELVGAERRAG